MLVLVLVLMLCVVIVGDGDGVALPIVGMSPAKAGTNKTKVRINAIPSLFMDFLLFESHQNLALRDTRNLVSANKQ